MSRSWTPRPCRGGSGCFSQDLQALGLFGVKVVLLSSAPPLTPRPSASVPIRTARNLRPEPFGETQTAALNLGGSTGFSGVHVCRPEDGNRFSFRGTTLSLLVKRGNGPSQ